MTEWNDGRLDDLSRKVDDGFRETGERIGTMDRKIDAGFARLDRKVDEGFGRLDKKIDHGLDRLDKKIDDRFRHIDDKFNALGDRLDGFYRVLVQGTVAVSVGILGLLGVLIGVIAIQ